MTAVLQRLDRRHRVRSGKHFVSLRRPLRLVGSKVSAVQLPGQRELQDDDGSEPLGAAAELQKQAATADRYASAARLASGFRARPGPPQLLASLAPLVPAHQARNRPALAPPAAAPAGALPTCSGFPHILSIGLIST